MTVPVPTIYNDLKKIRKSTSCTLKSNDLLKSDFPLRYYQVIGTFHILSLKRMVLGDDTGIGKTAQNIAAFCYLKKKDPELKLVVVSPKSALGQWKEEFEKFSRNINAEVISSAGASSRLAQYKAFFQDPERHVLILNYHLLVRDYNDFLESASLFMIVYDEATAFKNYKSKTFHACQTVANEAQRVVALTATLLKNHLIEGYSIYECILPGIFGGITKFKRNFCIERKMLIQRGNRRFRLPVIVGYKNLDEFRSVIDPFFLGRKKQEVSDELPDLTTKEVPCEMTKDQAKAYQDALLGLLELDSGEVIETDQLTKMIYCQQIANSPSVIDIDASSGKEKEFFRLLEEDFAGQKIIVYTRFKKLVNRMEDLFKQKKIPMLRVTGDEDNEQRTLARLMFGEEKEKIRVFLEEQPKRRLAKWKREVNYLKEKIWPNVIFITDAGSESINLQTASVLLFFESPWSFGTYQQILGRMIRIGSKHNKVLAVHLVSIGTIDKYVLRALNKKKVMIEQVLGKTKKGTLEFEHETELKDIFDSMVADAKRLKR